jgi:thioredoxin-related protein
MRIIFLSLFLAVSSIVTAQLPLIEIGAQLPDGNIKMKCATSGNEYTLQSLNKENGLLVIFSCNTCPFVMAWEDRYPTIAKLAKENKIGFALLNSNDAKRDNADSFEAMQSHAKEKGYIWPYLYDDQSKIANTFGAQTTPHVFLFDKNGKLVYKGAIDDNYKDASAVTHFYLKDALTSLGTGKEIANAETRNLGCSIKRKID